MGFLFLIVALAVLSGAALGWLSLFRIAELRRELAALRKQLNLPAEPSPAPTPKADAQPPPPDRGPEADYSWRGTGNTASAPPKASSPSYFLLWRKLLREQWMAWLGGLCVGLAGIFLVRHSIAQGYLGPGARIVLGLSTGVLLHGLAEWLRRRSGDRFEAPAALAGGASIILFAALLAALRLYQLLPPTLVFVLLALVSLLTMALALVHGPLPAILGLLGAYAVPLLVQTDAGGIAGVLVYSLLVSAAVMALMQFVYRPWLWVGMMAGSLLWWSLSVAGDEAGSLRGFYLAALAWLVLAGPGRDWMLNRPQQAAGTGVAGAPVAISLWLILGAWGVSIYVHGTAEAAIWYWTPLVLLLFAGARRQPALQWLPWLSLGVQALAWLGSNLAFMGDGLRLAGLAGADQTAFLTLAISMTVVYTLLSLWLMRIHPKQARWVALALLAPLAWLALAYLLLPRIAGSMSWGSLAVFIAVVYFSLASRFLRQGRSDATTVWLVLAGHFAWSLAVAIMLREAGLTVALAAQLVSLAWARRRFGLPWLETMIKCVLAVIVLRLTANPWLLSYPVDLHWSLWTYGSATALCALAAWQTDAASHLRRWLELGTLHLLVLTLASEVRYWLYDGAVFSPRLMLEEIAIDTTLFAALGLVAFLRSRVSANLQTVHEWASRLLAGLALTGYLLMLSGFNPLWSGQPVSATPLWNILLLAYGAPVLLAVLFHRWYDPRWRIGAALFAGLATFVFVNMEIRHLWQGRLDIGFPVVVGELYTYSAVWLAMAVVTMLLGSLRYGAGTYRAGFLLLLLVIVKLFLVDMADLEGLWRVASFMGLGLSLLGLAWFYQKFDFSGRSMAPVTSDNDDAALPPGAQAP